MKTKQINPGGLVDMGTFDTIPIPWRPNKEKKKMNPRLCSFCGENEAQPGHAYCETCLNKTIDDLEHMQVPDEAEPDCGDKCRL